ncbi:MAG: hypothetical protein ACU84Q_18220 [Gammaproteobacteria bacterium]
MTHRSQLMLLGAALMLLLSTLLDPKALMARDTYRYVYVFDISLSMNVADVPGTANDISRLEYAKKVAIESLELLPCGTEIGLALFTGHRAFLLLTPVEVCANLLELSGVINNVDWQMTWKLRSEIAKGIHKSVKLMSQLHRETRLAFFTDGHEAPPVHPDLAPKFSGDKGAVGGIIIGVGGNDPSPIPKFNNDGSREGYFTVDDVMHVDSFTASQNAREGRENKTTGTEHLSALREDYLKQVATDTGLLYKRIGTPREFSASLMDDSLGIPGLKTTRFSWLLALFGLLLVMLSLKTPRQDAPARSAKRSC